MVRTFRDCVNVGKHQHVDSGGNGTEDRDHQQSLLANFERARCTYTNDLCYAMTPVMSQY